MKRAVLLAVSAGLAAAVQSASAADLGKSIKPPAHAPYNWSGLYIGGHAGYGWGDEDWSLPDPIPNASFFGASGLPGHSPSGLLAGGQIGINYQTGPWVFGVEGQFSWADLEDKSTQVLSNISTADFRSRVEYLGSVTARIGYTIQPTVLLYLKGGLAFDSSRLDAALTIADQTAAIATFEQDRLDHRRRC